MTWFKCGWNNQVWARVQQITASHLTTVDEDRRASSGSMISKVVSLSPSSFQILISDLVTKTDCTLQMTPMVGYKRGSMKFIERRWLNWCKKLFHIIIYTTCFFSCFNSGKQNQLEEYDTAAAFDLSLESFRSENTDEDKFSSLLKMNAWSCLGHCNAN